MRRIITPLFLLSMISAPAAFAEDTYTQSDSSASQAGTAAPSDVFVAEEDIQEDVSLSDQPGAADAGVTTAAAEDVTRGGLKHQAFSIIPQVGAINYRDTLQGVNNRHMLGLTMDFNATQYFTALTGVGEGSPLYIGPSLGFFYSHIGGNDANFLGNDSSGLAGGDGTNMMLFPLNLKLGWNFSDAFRFALHGGGNVFYRSNASAMALGYSPTAGTDPAWTMLPNIGADLEFGFANRFAITLRPDYTPSGSNSVWTGTVGAAFFLG